MEARIWLPDTVGSWPAFWGLYDGWPPEMDIMEYPLGAYANDEYHTAFHYVNTSGGNSSGAGKVNPSNAGDLRGGWHTFAVNWVEDSSVRFYFDGVQASSFTNGTEVAEMVSMYLILNYAVGGWPAVPSTTDWPVGFTDETKVDWVRVWKAGRPAPPPGPMPAAPAATGRHGKTLLHGTMERPTSVA
ncbi:MAG: glycoside hydrolase family 16 protein [Akkermansiaceae bacterium]|nr:glycoside hydrolase family 16 protein [Akkermansiaceae bacterium]